MADANQDENNNRRKPQTRGLERRKQILACAKDMLSEHEEISLSIYDIAKKSGIPASSIYHFFPKTNDIFEAILDEYLQLFDDCIAEPINPKEVNHWSDIGRILETRMLNIYQENELIRRMILGQHTYGELLKADQEHDQKLGRTLQEIYQQFYQLPTLPAELNIFAIALQISDKIYAMSHQNHGQITDVYAQEGWNAAKAYLSIYLPQYLEKQQDNIYETLALLEQQN